MKTEVYKQLSELLPLAEILYDEPMSKHTTFRVGGAADVFVRIASEDQLKVLIPELVKSEIPYYIIGKGSNLLVGDKGFRGVVIQLDEAFENIKVNNNIVTACAGASMAKIAKTALQNSLTGFEFAAGIPGCVGGGVIMNAGAYGGEMKDVVESCCYLDENLEIKEMNLDDMALSYRHSIFCETGYVILGVKFKLEKGDKSEITSKMSELMEKRRSKQPLEYPSAGSTFKRPESDFAGRLIEASGLKGFTCGGAQVSEKHSGFVINKGNATCADVLGVISAVKEKVYEDSGVMLECEIRILE